MTALRLSANVLVAAATFRPRPLVGKQLYPPLLDAITAWWVVDGPCRGVTGQFHYN